MDWKDAKSIRGVFELWKADAENKSGNRVSFLQTDEGGEYENVMHELLHQTGITHLRSPPYLHQSNGLAERLNRTLKDACPPESMWDKRAYRAVYVGTDSQSGYELWDLRNRRFDHMHHCNILENEFPTSEDFPPSKQYQKRRRGEKRNLPPISTVIEEPERPKLPEQPKSPDLPILDTIIVESGAPLPPHESNAAQSELLVNDKPSLEEALSSLEAPKWRQVMLEELHSIDENRVWELRPVPPDLRVLGLRWVLTVKRNAQGNIDRYKARSVVQGF
jgi:hypothetical protein